MNFKIPFSGRSHKYNKNEIEAVVNSMNDGQTLTQGVKMKEFENIFSKYIGEGDAFAVNSATSALELAAQLCLFNKGDEVICPSHTYTASLYPFIKNGAKPVWVDISSETMVTSLDLIKKKVTKKTKAILAIHLYGYCINDIEKIAQFAKSRGIILIEDVAQAIGTEIGNKKAGTFGDFGIYSFHSHKNISTLGEGGILLTKVQKYIDIIPMLRHNGHCDFDFPREKYWIPAMGNVDLPKLDNRILYPNNFCIGEAQCALGVELVKRIDSINSQKRKRAITFINSISESKIITFNKVNTTQHNYHLLVGKVSGGHRDTIIDVLSKKYGIQCVVQYYPLNRYDLYSKLNLSNSDCENADDFYDNMISFPFQHWMSDEDFNYMLEKTKAVLSNL